MTSHNASLLLKLPFLIRSWVLEWKHHYKSYLFKMYNRILDFVIMDSGKLDHQEHEIRVSFFFL